MKLYRIKLKGLHGAGINTDYGWPYVIAKNPSDALKRVQDYLNENDYGFSFEREMDIIELLAEEGDNPNCKIQLFL